jgi:hypothetical protein
MADVLSFELFWSGFGVGLGALVIAAGARSHARRPDQVEAKTLILDDAAIDRIIQQGKINIDEKDVLDLETIQDEEVRFWLESWDEPEEEW